jgi:hypothetical protein
MFNGPGNGRQRCGWCRNAKRDDTRKGRTKSENHSDGCEQSNANASLLDQFPYSRKVVIVVLSHEVQMIYEPHRYWKRPRSEGICGDCCHDGGGQKDQKPRVSAPHLPSEVMNNVLQNGKE